MTKFNNNFFSLSNSLDYIFNLMDNPSYTYTWTFPNVDIPKVSVPSYPPGNGYILKDGTLKIELACTGFSKEELSISSEDNTLSVVGEIKVKEEISTTVFHNLKVKDFEWKVKIHEKYNVENLSIQLLNGLLEIWIPLKEESKPKRKEFTII